MESSKFIHGCLDYRPFVSLILPIRNEAAHVREFFVPLLNQTYPKDRMEILVVDGMSEDGTRQIVQEFIHANGHAKVRLVDNPKKQRAPALNLGIKHATGDIVLRIDARTVIPNDYIEKCVQISLATGADNVGGMQVPIVTEHDSNRKKLAQRAISLALTHSFGVGNAQFRLGKKSGYVDTVYLGCFKKDVFDRVGLFDEDAPVISEDADMNYRIRKAGGKVYFDKDIIAYYYPRDNLKDLAKLYFRYGGAKAGNLLKTKQLTAWRQWVPPFFLLAIVIISFASIFSVVCRFLLAAILGIYFLVDMLVSAKLAVGEKRLVLFHRLFVVFPTLHFSWATGFFIRLMQRPKQGKYWGY
jgi:glycosyltransferase involved in cell wall biosynthesis